MSGPLRVDTMTVFVAVDAEGDEGICGWLVGDQWLPLVAADQARADRLRPIAQDIATATGLTISVRRFSQREDLETIRPRGDGP